MMNFTKLYSMILIIDIYIYQEQSGPSTELRDTIFYWTLIGYMTIYWNNLFSVNEIGFKPITLRYHKILFSLFSLANKISYSIVPKAFHKSTKIPQLIFSLSKFFLISSSVRLIRRWKVEYCCLKPNFNR